MPRTVPRPTGADPGLTAALAELIDGAEGAVRFLGPRGEVEAETGWRELLQAGARIAAGLRSSGARAGESVAVAGRTSPETVSGIFGVLFAGCRLLVLPLRPEPGSDRHLRLAGRSLRLAGASRLLLGPGAAWGSPVAPPDVKVGEIGDLLAARPGPVDAVTRPASSATAIIQFSSGTTALPAGLQLSNGAIAANLRAATRRVGVTAEDCLVSWLPLYHDMGLIGTLLWPVLHGMSAVYLPTEAYARRPHLWLEAVSGHRGTVLCAPNFAFRIAGGQLALDHDLDLSSVRVAVCGSELVRYADVDRFRRAAEPAGLPPGSICPCYGLAEATLAVTISPPGRDLVTAAPAGRGPADGPSAAGCPDVGCGPPLEGVDVRIGDVRHPFPDGVPGEVLVRTPARYSAVVGNGGTGAGEPVGPAGGAWLPTGDIGYLDNGDLYLRGRVKELIIVGGRNILPQDIEDGVADLLQIRPGRAVAFGLQDGGREQVVVVAEAAGGTAAAAGGIRATIRRVVSEEHGVSVSDVVVVPEGTIERTTSGKLRRVAMRSRYLRGELERGELERG